MGGFKAIISSIAAAGTAQIVGNIVDATTAPNAKLTTRVLTWIGSAALCWMVGCYAGDYAEHCVDSTKKLIKSLSGEEEIEELVGEGTVE